MRYFSLFFLALGIGSLAAQTTKLSVFAQEINYDKNGSAHFIRFKEQQQVTTESAKEFLAALFFAQSEASLRELTTEQDVLGYTHVRYQVYVKDVLVQDKIVIGHFKAGKLYAVNGDLKDDGAAVNTFVISEQKAFEQALKKVGAQKYKWENVEEEQQMRAITGDKLFSYQARAQKVYYPQGGKLIAAYKFNIYAEQPLYRADVFVNAETAAVIAEHSQICTVNTPGTAATKYSGTQPIQCDLTNSVHTLRESTRGLGVETYNCGNTTTYAMNNFTSTTATWSLSTFNQGALDAHWGAETTYDYYWNIHNRNSINNAGFKLVSFVHYGNNFNNAFWDGQRMTYGDGSGSYRIFTTLDICGHEISHGLTSNSAGLQYQDESGALNESYSDIFGACIEAYGRPSNWNWKIGEDMTVGGGGLRNMSNPNLFGDPDTYGGTNWYGGTADNGGVHTNSGVSNFWFYLLTQGGNGTNDLGNAYSVSGIGITNAARIAFRALTVYYTPTTNYTTARNLSIQAAKDLFGDCSAEMIATINAWHAVGIGNKFVPGSLAPNFTADITTWCNLPATVNFANQTPYATGFVWDFGDGTAVTTATNVAHTYTAAGAYTVKLKALGCNMADSVLKNSFVVVNIPQAPAMASYTVCERTAVSLTASANNTLRWYDDPISQNVIATGSVANLASITSNTTIYVANTIANNSSFGGMPSAIGGGFLSNATQYLVFDVVQSGTLNSVVVNAGGAGTRTVELRDNLGQLINAVPVMLSSGTNTVVLYFQLTPGTGYRLGLAGTVANLYRSNQGVSYPYNVGNCVNIVGSSAGPSNYYWFYKWEVTPEDCKSAFVPVSISVAPAPQVSLQTLPQTVCADDAFVLSGIPAGGVFSGAGVSGSQFMAAGQNPGTYTVVYAITGNNGCVGTDAKTLQVAECMGISSVAPEKISMYPNPVLNSLTISGAEEALVEIHDLAGRLIHQTQIHSTTQSINFSDFANGVYLLSLQTSDGSKHNYRIVKE